MKDAYLQRAEILIEQNRYREAEKELRQAIALEPGNSRILGLLAVCCLDQDKYGEAEDLIKKAISISPSDHWLFYLYASLLNEQGRQEEAEARIREAIALHPFEANYFGLLASIYFNSKDWKGALEYAERGLACDPDNLVCLNLRSSALYKMNDKDAAYETIKEALRQDPYSAMTHTNLGWSLLEKVDHRKALEHFKIALQLDPGNEWAKAGLVEALKARYFIYRMFLKYAFWLSNLEGKLQWFLIIGFYAGSRLVRYVAETYPALYPFLMPLVVLYVLFAISSWVIIPLSNLFLKFNVYGRYALTREESISANFVGASLLAGILGIISYFITSIEGWLVLGIVGISLMIPLASMLNPPGRKERIILVGATILIAALGIFSVLQVFSTGQWSDTYLVYLISVFGFTWLANFLIIKK